MRSGLDCSLHPVDSSRRFATERIHEIHICASRHLAITSACTSTRYARITSPVCPSEYCGRQAINGISGNERRTKTHPETRFDCQMPNAVWQLSNKIEVETPEKNTSTLLNFPLYGYWHLSLRFSKNFLRAIFARTTRVLRAKRQSEKRGGITNGKLVVRVYSKDRSRCFATYVEVV